MTADGIGREPPHHRYGRGGGRKRSAAAGEAEVMTSTVRDTLRGRIKLKCMMGYLVGVTNLRPDHCGNVLTPSWCESTLAPSAE